mgnify:FL=1
MKILRNIALLFSLVALLMGCEPLPSNYVTVVVDSSVTCTYDAHTFDLRYNIKPSLDGTMETIGRYTTAEDSWVESVDCTEEGVLHITVAANEGTGRSTTITLSGDNFRSVSIKVNQMAAPTAAVDRTLIFHFFGTSLNRYFNTNIEDATQAISEGALGTNNRVVCIIQSSKSEGSIFELCYNPSDSSVIKRHISDFTLSGSLVTPTELSEIIAKAANAAPANSYAMVFAGHGTAWIPRSSMTSGASTLSAGINPWTPAPGAEVTRTFGETNIMLDISELAEGIELSGVELEYILFDACFMANIETIYDLRNVAHYIIASPCEIMGRGFPYHRTLHHLFGDNFNLTSAAESYYLYYRNEYNGAARCGSVALFDCAEIEALKDATHEIMLTATNDYDRKALQTYEGQPIHYFYDFGEWVNAIATDETALATFNEQLNRVVVAKFTLPTFYSAFGSYGTYNINEDVYSGVTTSGPSDAFPYEWRECNWYNATKP